MMKRWRLRVALAATVAFTWAVARAEPPAIRAVEQKPHHCGVASAQTILRAYGDRRPWANQKALAAALCARTAEVKHRRPAAADAAETYYPQFQETYQGILAELLIDYGYCVISTRSSVDSKTGEVRPGVWELLREHLAQGHLAVIHVPGHYVAATGVDQEQEILYFVDPYRTGQVFSTTFATFAGGQSFHTKRSGDPRPGWDGRALIFWKGEPINQPNRCPVCGKEFAGQSYTFCRRCRCMIDRREHNRVQRVLDAIIGCTRDLHLTEVDAGRLQRSFRGLLESGEFTEADLRAALLHYPLASDDPDRFATLHRHAEAEQLDLSPLTLDELAAVVTAGEQWKDLLAKQLE